MSELERDDQAAVIEPLKTSFEITLDAQPTTGQHAPVYVDVVLGGILHEYQHAA